MRTEKWKLFGTLILFIPVLFLGVNMIKDMITEFRINRAISKMTEQHPKLPYDKSAEEAEGILTSIFQDQMPCDSLLQFSLIWSNDQWNLTSVKGLESYLESPGAQKILHKDLAPALPSPDITAPEGWYPQRMCELVRMDSDITVKVHQSLRDSFPQELKTEYIHPFRDFGYPVGQRPGEDHIQKALNRQEFHLQEDDKESSFLGEARIIRDHNTGKVRVAISLYDVDNSPFEKGLGEVLSSHFQDLMKFNASLTFSVKDQLGEAKKEYSPEGITEEKRWIIRLPDEEGFLYYLVAQLDF